MAWNVVFLEEADGLDGFAETHLVGEDGAVLLAPGVDHEVQPVHLVFPQPVDKNNALKNPNNII